MNNKKQITIITAVSVCISASLLFLNRKERSPEIVSKVFPVAKGWGYDILLNGKLFIRQKFIPVISGGEGFPDRAQAETVAHLVVSKIKAGLPPSITESEITTICKETNTKNAEQGKN